MGYTRYYNEVKVDYFSKDFVDKVNIIIKKAKEDYGVIVRDWQGFKEPTINIKEIILNGDATADKDLYHEKFSLKSEDEGFNCCKTARKPYDMVVHAILKLALYHGYIGRLSNDGETDLDKKAMSLLGEVLK